MCVIMYIVVWAATIFGVKESFMMFTIVVSTESYCLCQGVSTDFGASSQLFT